MYEKRILPPFRGSTEGPSHRERLPRVLAFADEHHITIADLNTGEVLSTHLIEPNKTYWRNQNKEPGRWPTSPN